MPNLTLRYQNKDSNTSVVLLLFFWHEGASSQADRITHATQCLHLEGS